MKSKGHRYHGAPVRESCEPRCRANRHRVRIGRRECNRARTLSCRRDSPRRGTPRIRANGWISRADHRSSVVARSTRDTIISRSREICALPLFSRRGAWNSREKANARNGEARARNERQAATDLCGRATEKRAFAEQL